MPTEPPNPNGSWGKDAVDKNGHTKCGTGEGGDGKMDTRKVELARVETPTGLVCGIF